MLWKFYKKGLASACSSLGVSIFEGSPVVSIKSGEKGARWIVHTDSGSKVSTNHVVLCASSHLSHEVDGQYARASVPMYTYIMVTKRIGLALQEAIASPLMVCDDRNALAYYRLLTGEHSGRLLSVVCLFRFALSSYWCILND